MVIIVILIHRYQLARPLTMLAKNITQITPGSDQRLITKKQNSGDELGVLTECANDFLAATEEALNNERSIRLELEKIQEQYNKEHGITPVSIKKSVTDILSTIYESDYYTVPLEVNDEELDIAPEKISQTINTLNKEMKDAAKNLVF